MAYRNNNPVFIYPKNPKNRNWLTNYAGGVVVMKSKYGLMSSNQATI